PNGRLALDLHVAFEIVDIEGRLCRVVDPPHDDRSDLDRIAALVVYFDSIAVEVARPERDFRTGGARRKRSAGRFGPFRGGLGAAARIKRVRPKKSTAPDGSVVAAEKQQNSRFVRLEGEVATEKNNREQFQPRGGEDLRDGQLDSAQRCLAIEEGQAAEKKGEINQ